VTDMRRFTLKPEHVKLLRRANVGWEDGEAGAPGLDTKRPYGNSDVFRDMYEILGEKMIGWGQDGWECWREANEKRMLALHRETESALSVILRAGSFEPGEYEADDSRDNWQRVK
jgi:hypothetical protein